MIRRELELHRLNTGRENRVYQVTQRLTQYLFKYQGHIGTGLIIGGVDAKGPHLAGVSPDGSSQYLPFMTTGSGSLAAMGIMETQYKENLTKEEAIKVCVASIEAGIYHDLGSGSNVDVIVIMKGKTEYLRNYKSDNKKVFSKPEGFKFAKGATQVLDEWRHKIVVS